MATPDEDEGLGQFTVEPHLEGGFWIGDGSGQFLRVMPQPGCEDEDWDRCRRVAQLLTQHGCDLDPEPPTRRPRARKTTQPSLP